MVTDEEHSSKMEIALEPQVQSSEVEAPQTEQENEVSRKKGRHRKKALYSAICQQMEFYFSDSNLTKDRFLAALVKRSPDINIEIFMNFNKIKSLTTEPSTIAKALKKSTLLKVSEDGTKVRRTTPIVEKTNVDECTVYVQRLPTDADHEWLQSQFSKYGKVTYVSVPKFTQTNKIKGFAFVEFDTPQEVENCLKDFKARGCVLPSQTAPEKVMSISTFQDQENLEENNLNNKQKDANEGEIEKPFESDNSKQKKKKKKKSKHNNFDNIETDQSESTKKKIENSDECSVVLKIEKEERKRKKKYEGIEDSETDELDTTKVKKRKESRELENNGEQKKKKKVKHDGHESFEGEPSECIKSKITKENDKNSDIHASDSNTEEEKRGKKRKNKHSSEDILISDSESQNIVDKSNKKRKKSIAEESEMTTAESDVNEADGEENKESKELEKKKKRKKRNRNSYEVVHTVVEYPLMGMQVMAKKDWKRLRNKYLDLQRSKMKQLKQHLRKVKWNQWGDKNKMETDIVETKKVNPASILEFSPGLIVKVKLNEPCIDPKSFKAELKNNNNVKYVDIKEGSSVAYIRCDSVEAATALSEKTSEEKLFTVLNGEEETKYWDQIKKDREEKLGDNKIRQKIRGRKKLLKKAEKELGKHIKFDD